MIHKNTTPPSPKCHDIKREKYRSSISSCMLNHMTQQANEPSMFPHLGLTIFQGYSRPQIFCSARLSDCATAYQ